MKYTVGARKTDHTQLQVLIIKKKWRPVTKIDIEGKIP